MYRRTDNDVKNYWTTRLKRRAAEIMSSNNSNTLTNPSYSGDNCHHYSNSTANSDTFSGTNATSVSSHNNVVKLASSTSAHESQYFPDISASKTEILSKSLHTIKDSRIDSSRTTTSTGICDDDKVSKSARSSSLAPRVLLNKIASKPAQVNLVRIIGNGGRISGDSGGGGVGDGYSSLESSSGFNSTPSINDNYSTSIVEDLLLEEAHTGFSAVCKGTILGEELMCQQGVENFDFDDYPTLEADNNNFRVETKANNNYYKAIDEDITNDSLEQLLSTSFSKDCFDDLIGYL